MMIIVHGVIDWLIENRFPPLYFWSDTVSGYKMFGYGCIDGYGNGYGDGDGYGYGNGNGYGYGDGDGYGDGYGYGKGY